MVQQKESVVTAERFAQGLTYDGFIKAIDRNQQRFQENYDGTQVSPEDAAKLKSLMEKPRGPAKIVLIGEPWCPDVFRGAPVFARMAEATGMELRVFFRDQNKDMIAEFRNGDFESIPVAVFYTKDMEYLGHWIERPELANREIHDLLGPMYARLRKPDMTEEERAAAREENIAFQNGPVWGNWRQETIREVTGMLETAVGG